MVQIEHPLTQNSNPQTETPSDYVSQSKINTSKLGPHNKNLKIINSALEQHILSILTCQVSSKGTIRQILLTQTGLDEKQEKSIFQ